jgi:hypothetical protein
MPGKRALVQISYYNGKAGAGMSGNKQEQFGKTKQNLNEPFPHMISAALWFLQ